LKKLSSRIVTIMDLKVVGAGHLGIRLALLWREKFPQSMISLKTKHYDKERSMRWSKSGFKPISSEQKEDDRVKAPFVVFCAPPTNNPNYPEDVERSIKHDWNNSLSEQKGSFIFTSSGGVYTENGGGTIDESSAVGKVSSSRTDTMLKTEQIVLENGGIAIRYGGLYTKCRGAHSYWLRENSSSEVEKECRKPNEFSSCPNGLINLIHYDDAARLLLKALLHAHESSKKLFLASDGVPISRENICKAALRCPFYKERLMPSFTGDASTVDGKRYDISLVSKTFNWKPKYDSFENFMVHHSDDEMDLNILFPTKL